MESLESKERKEQEKYIKEIIESKVNEYYNEISVTEIKNQFAMNRFFFDVLNEQGIIEPISDERIKEEMLKEIITAFCIKMRTGERVKAFGYDKIYANMDYFDKYWEINDILKDEQKDIRFIQAKMFNITEENKHKVWYREDEAINYFQQILEIMCKNHIHIRLDVLDLFFEKEKDVYYVICQGKYDFSVRLDIKNNVCRYWNILVVRQHLYSDKEKSKDIFLMAYERECFFLHYLLLIIYYFCENEKVKEEDIMINAFKVFSINRKYSTYLYKECEYIKEVMQSEVNKLIRLDTGFARYSGEEIEASAKDRIRNYLKSWVSEKNIFIGRKYEIILNEIKSMCKVYKNKTKALEAFDITSCLKKIQNNINMNCMELTAENYENILYKVEEMIYPRYLETEQIDELLVKQSYDIKREYQKKLSRYIFDVKKREAMVERYAQYEFLLYGCFILFFRDGEKDFSVALKQWEIMHEVLTMNLQSETQLWDEAIEDGINLWLCYSKWGRDDIKEIEEIVENMKYEEIIELLSKKNRKKLESKTS